MHAMSLQKIEQWMSHYYQNPQPELIRPAIEGLREEGKLGDENAIEQIIFFLSFLFSAHPEKAVEWTSPFIEGDLPVMEKKVLITALWLSDTQRAKDYLARLALTVPELQEYIEDLTTGSPPDLERMPIDYPGILDSLWAAFMATGESRFVIRIISALAGCDSEDAIGLLIGNAARWSLKSNAEDHAAVRSICEEQLAEQPPKIAAILRKIIEEEE
jgi:hypothetical protein